ncbi:hypothetical protein [Paenacidovorax monticola]|uniref:Uncharacterized protein n=1 Tax=Paenacidovorax monticola TaxID=1926868 RepID=A0A7H0HHQ4_9BURK|nr:hypothetical protein [Paenacidovorax monticola]QNP60070.1 hypothetical protein H9L24_03880 [Paenacidovorax monticola]
MEHLVHGGEDIEAWDNAHAQLLERVYVVLRAPAVHPAVLMKAAQSASWHAMYNDGSVCQPRARSIIALLDREPFKEDLDLKAHCEEILKGLSKLDPAHALHLSLLRHAEDGIDRQAKEKEAMLEEED